MRLGYAVLAFLLACGGAPAAPPRTPAARPSDAGVAFDATDAENDAGTDADARLALASIEDASSSASTLVDADVSPADAGPAQDAGGACVVVDFGLDLRALPGDPSPSGIDMFVFGQMEDVRRLAPSTANVEMRHWPGVGLMYAVFRARTEHAAMGACTRTTRAYLAQAPRLPIIMEPAAQVTTACRPCP